MNLVEILAVYGALWLGVTVVGVVALCWWWSRGEPAFDEEPGGEVVTVDFRRNGTGRAA